MGKKKREIPEDVRMAVVQRDRGCVGRRLIPNVECWSGFDLHHVKRRSQGGEDTIENLVCLCRPHHSWVHSNVGKAKELGLLRSAYE